MKNRLIFTFLLAFMVVLGCSGCSNKNKSLFDFDEFKDINVSSISSIDVSVDIGEFKRAEFSIVDQYDIESIIVKYKEKNTFEYFGKDLDTNGRYPGDIIIHNENKDYKVSLKEIDGYIYSSSEIHDLIRSIGKKNDCLKVYLGVRELKDFVHFDFENLTKIEVGWQTTKDYKDGGIVYFTITDKKSIDDIVKELSKPDTFVSAEPLEEKTNYSYIRVYDNKGHDSILNLTQIQNYLFLNYTSDNLRNFIHDYGVTNGYLQN